MASNSLEKSEKSPKEKFEKYEWFVSCYDIIKSFKPLSSEEKSKYSNKPSTSNSTGKNNNNNKSSYFKTIKSKGKSLFDQIHNKKSKKNANKNYDASFSNNNNNEPNVAFVNNHLKNVRNSHNNENNKNDNFDIEVVNNQKTSANGAPIDSKSLKSQSYLQSVISEHDLDQDGEELDSIKVEDSISNVKPNEHEESTRERSLQEEIVEGIKRAPNDETNDDDRDIEPSKIVILDESEQQIAPTNSKEDDEEIVEEVIEIQEYKLAAKVIIDSVIKASSNQISSEQQSQNEKQSQQLHQTTTI